MRFICHHEKVILIQNADIKRDGLFVGYGTVVPDKFVRTGRGVVGDAGAIVGHNFTVCDALGDGGVCQMRKPPAQIVDNGAAGVGGNAQPGGSDAAAHGKGWCGHGV